MFCLSIYLSIPKYSLTTSCFILCCRNTKHAKLNVSTYPWWVMKWSPVFITMKIRVNSTGQEVANLCCVSRLNIISIYFYYHQHNKGQPFYHCTIITKYHKQWAWTAPQLSRTCFDQYHGSWNKYNQHHI